MKKFAIIVAIAVVSIGSLSACGSADTASSFDVPFGEMSYEQGYRLGQACREGINPDTGNKLTTEEQNICNAMIELASRMQ